MRGILRFDASCDGREKVATAATLAAVGVAGVAVVASVGQRLHVTCGHFSAWFVSLLFLFVPVALLFAASRGASRAWAIDGDAVRIERRAGPPRVPRPHGACAEWA